MSEKRCTRCEMSLPLAAFTAQKRGMDGLQAACKACEVERVQVWKHGLTTLEREQIATLCDGCAICGRTEPGAKGWVIDHDHTCCPGDPSCPSCRRGVLCPWCNSALGYAGDDPERLRRMADFLELGTRLDSDEWTTLLASGSESDRTPVGQCGSDPTNERDERDGRIAGLRISLDSRPNVRLRTGDSHMSRPNEPHAASRGANARRTDG